ncbi:hypothetical protein AVEN_130198-1 [Araneus ventricosus]|uniref:Uncharacterized protein n=1 Tax=Araneus ventricosus TaxID=182803 RepID=A0A4Y2U4H3_ARAVE|nr:hypothetical protein AVEN_130198-1 [Araneus ventricosus]
MQAGLHIWDGRTPLHLPIWQKWCLWAGQVAGRHGNPRPIPCFSWGCRVAWFILQWTATQALSSVRQFLEEDIRRMGRSGEGNCNSQPPSENHPGNKNSIAERVGPIATENDKLPYFKSEVTLQGLLDDIRSDYEDGDTLPHQDESSSSFSVDEGPQPFSQSELNDLVRDLGLSKDGTELLGPRLKNKNLLTPGTSFSWYRHREKEFTQFFSKEGNLVFRNDGQGLKKCFDIECDPSEWRLFIDSSETNLKAVLLHNGNSFASLPLGRSVHLEENYNDLSMIFEKVKYQEHRWLVCGDFKMLTMLLGQQAGYTKYPCSLCLWDSRARDLYWTKHGWSLRDVSTPGDKKCHKYNLGST